MSFETWMPGIKPGMTVEGQSVSSHGRDKPGHDGVEFHFTSLKQ
jgi:hypothetical protein